MSSGIPIAPPTPTNLTWFDTFRAYLQSGLADIEAEAQTVAADFIPMLDLVEQDLPTAGTVIATVLNVITVAFPQAGALTAYANEAIGFVEEAVKFIVTEAGVVMSPALAQQVGATVVGPATTDQQTAAVVAAMTSAYPDTPPIVHALAVHTVMMRRLTTAPVPKVPVKSVRKDKKK